MPAAEASLESYIRSIPDFPKPGIVFRDITPLLASPAGLQASVGALVEQLGGEVVGCAFLIELAFLGGRAVLQPHAVHSLISYDAE